MKKATDSVRLKNALEKLYRRRQFGIKLGLEPVRRMCELLGSPEREYGIIHVAGTNGKGSTCAMIASILRSAGIRTGMYTSPHLAEFNERIKIDGEDLSDADLSIVLEECEDAAKKVKSEIGHDATFFEIATLMAFAAFRRAGVKVAVIETGLGGRLDATNVVTPLVSVIMPISLEHTEHLGKKIEEIAQEKAGIIKPGRTVVVADQPDVEALEVLREVASERKAPLVPVSEAVTLTVISSDIRGQKIRVESSGGISVTARLPLAGAHQAANAATAVAAVDTFFNMAGIELDPAVVKKGLECVRWPGRCQILSESPLTIADAAHNPAGARALVKLLKQNGIRKAEIILGMCGDKDVAGVVNELAPLAAKIWIVPIDNPRNIDAKELAALIRSHDIEYEIMDSPEEAVKAATAASQQSGNPVVITGSLFLLGELLKKA
jgi:dihydrofolate synthase/folylpolyglutamate synthase